MGLRNKGLEAGVAPLTIIPGNPLEGYLISSTLGSVDPEVLIPKKNSSTWEYNENPIKYMAMTAAQSCWGPHTKSTREGQGSPL